MAPPPSLIRYLPSYSRTKICTAEKKKKKASVILVFDEFLAFPPSSYPSDNQVCDDDDDAANCYADAFTYREWLIIPFMDGRAEGGSLVPPEKRLSLFILISSHF
jgi:hypothetical protein